MADGAREGSRVVVRPATPDDAEALARLLAAFNAGYDAAPLPVAVLARRYAALLAGSVALLEDLYVAPPLRNHGIGSLLMDAVLGRPGTACGVRREASTHDTCHCHVVTCGLVASALAGTRWMA